MVNKVHKAVFDKAAEAFIDVLFAHLETLSDEGLAEARAAVDELSTSNCWYVVYGLKSSFYNAIDGQMHVRNPSRKSGA